MSAFAGARFNLGPRHRVQLPPRTHQRTAPDIRSRSVDGGGEDGDEYCDD